MNSIHKNISTTCVIDKDDEISGEHAQINFDVYESTCIPKKSIYFLTQRFSRQWINIISIFREILIERINPTISWFYALEIFSKAYM